MGLDSNIISIYDNLTGPDEILNHTDRMGLQILTSPHVFLKIHHATCDPSSAEVYPKRRDFRWFHYQKEIGGGVFFGNLANQSLFIVDVHVENRVLAKKVPNF